MKKENQNRKIPLYFITIGPRTTECKVIIDNSSDWGNLGDKKAKCSGSQATEVL